MSERGQKDYNAALIAKEKGEYEKLTTCEAVLLARAFWRW